MNEFSRLEIEKSFAFKELAKRMKGYKAKDKNNITYRKQQEELNNKRKEISKKFKNKQKKLLESAGLLQIAALPINIQERDATSRALKWFREISDKTGIDFFKKFKIEKQSSRRAQWSDYLKSVFGFKNECAALIKEGM